MLHTFDRPFYTKNEKYMEKHDCNHIFSCISNFSYSMVHQKYATWVLLGLRIKIFIQRVLALEI